MSAVLTARVGRNADLFADVLAIYVPKGARVLDMTWGKGNFWTSVNTDDWRLTRNDAVTEADTHEDFRATSFASASFDAVILDPPYALHGTGTPIKASISSPYNLNHALTPTSAKQVREVYAAGIAEARRLLVIGGVLIVKCQDQIESGRQHFIHADLLALDGFRCEDLFVMVQPTQPTMRHDYQNHARKNHSYFIVHRLAARSPSPKPLGVFHSPSCVCPECQAGQKPKCDGNCSADNGPDEFCSLHGRSEAGEKV